jgi:ABC-type long-subunit fatty acid transport system fused permease/ATPase subunit
MSEETQSVRITQHMIYQKQLEMNDTQIQMLQKLENLEGVPDRIREVEIQLARLAWIERVSYAGLTGAVVAIIGLLINTIGTK